MSKSVHFWTRLACMVLIAVAFVSLPGCAFFDQMASGPTEKVDTDGDGVPDRDMTAEQAIAWGKQAEKQANADLELEKSAAAEAIRKAKQDATLKITAANNANKRFVDEANSQLEADVAIINAECEDAIGQASGALAKFAASKQAEVDRVAMAANNAIDRIEKKQAMVASIVNNPQLQGLASLVPWGGTALGLVGTVAGTWMGRSSGFNKGHRVGEEKGWNDRDQFQTATVDKNYDDGHNAARNNDLLSAVLRLVPGANNNAA